MSVSKYHLLQYIVNDAKHANVADIDWSAWFQSISKIYNRNIPEQVLAALARIGIDDLTKLCEYELQIQNLLRSTLEKLQEERRNAWIKRVDEGNIKAREARVKRFEANEEVARDFAKQVEESIVKQMLPTWKKQLDDYAMKRDELFASM